MIHTFLFPLQSLAANAEEELIDSKTEPVNIVKIIAGEKEKIPLYKEAEQIAPKSEADKTEDRDESDIGTNESSNILFYFNDGDKVEIVEEFESYSFVEFVPDKAEKSDDAIEDSHILQGYIENQYLQTKPKKDVTENDSNPDKESIEEESDSDKEVTEEEDNSEEVSPSAENNLAQDATEEEDKLGEETSEEEYESDKNVPKKDSDDQQSDSESKDSGDKEIKEENNNISTFSTSSKNYRGVAERKETYIRKRDSTKSDELLIVPIGTILEYTDYREYWYQTTVTVDGKTETGYIHKKHVENAVDPVDVRGVTKKSPTNVRKRASTKADVAQVYPIGSIIEYKTFSTYWYEVFENGKAIGFIHRKHVENSITEQKNIRGVALKTPTNVRERASTKADVAKQYPVGSIIEYKSFSNYWYEATFDGGKLGYIHKKHVDNSTHEHEEVIGVALKSPTNIRTLPSTKSKVLATYSIGSVIEYKTFNNYWYEVVMIINGERKSGFVHKKHVENSVENQETRYGIAIKSPTNVRARASTKSNIIYDFSVDSKVEYKSFSNYWYEVSVEVDGEHKTGYIHKKHLGTTDSKIFRGVTVKEPTYIRSQPSTKSENLTTYPRDKILEYKYHNGYWNKVSITINGKTRTGYIHDNHIDNVKNKTYQGVALNKTTYIRTQPNTKSDQLITVPNGTIINYHLYNEYWYEALVNINGKEKTGFIHKYHIEEAKLNTQKIEGFALRSPTNVREFASTDANVMATFTEGTKVKYENFTSFWHKVTATVNGVQRTGYVHKYHIGTKAEFHKKTNYNYDYKVMVDKQMAGTPKADGAGKKDATRGQVEFYTNPLNFMKGTKEYFQFLVLSQSAGLDAFEVNDKLLNGKGVLQGTGQAFVDAGREYNINEVYLIAHALHETGNGNSTLASGVPVDKNGTVTRNSKGDIAETSKTEHIVYNMYGYGAYDKCPIECGAKYAFDQGWFSLPAAVVGGAGNIVNYIQRGQDTLYKMKWNPINPGYPQYATHVQWATLQTTNIYDIYNSLNSYNIVFDVPSFRNLPNYSGSAFGLTTASSLNLRSGPGTNFTPLGSLPKDSEVQIVGSNANGWYNVKSNGTKGWVSAQYVNLKY